MFRSICHLRAILTAARAMQTSAPTFEANATRPFSPTTGEVHPHHFDSLRVFVTSQYSQHEKAANQTPPLMRQPTAAVREVPFDTYVLCEDDVVLINND
jgi:hypothetical protein